MSWQAGDYCTLADVKTWIDITSTNHDGLLEQIIRRSSREIDRYCGRRFYGVIETRYFDAIDSTDGQRLLLDEDLAGVITIIDGDGTTLTSSEYVLEPLNRTPKNSIRLKESSSNVWQAWNTDPEAAISVRGTWGYVAGTVPPEDIKQACISLVNWRYQQRQAPFGQTGMGDLEAHEVSSGIPEDVQRMLAPFRAPKIAGVGWV